VTERVLVVGGTGMLGHALCRAWRDRFDTWATVRGTSGAVDAVVEPSRIVRGVDAEDPDGAASALATVEPTTVVNAVGLVKQREAGQDPLPALLVNAVWPQRLAAACRAADARLVHVSTDCVFSGLRGSYCEDDVPDASDTYGRTKLLGEVDGAGNLTIRTSMIGRELARTTGLVEWLLSQRGGQVEGWTRARFTGLTTGALAGVLGDVVEHHRDLEGVWHVAGPAIDKHALLVMVRDAYGAPVDIRPDASVVVDRTLDDARFRAATGWTPPAGSTMVEAMAADTFDYDRLRSTAC
jgi:dTDP-4-dehydrorhamnose reductase